MFSATYELEGMDLVQCINAMQDNPGRALSYFDRDDSCGACGSLADEGISTGGHAICSACIDIDSLLLD
jgi:hypothetical protein